MLWYAFHLSIPFISAPDQANPKKPPWKQIKLSSIFHSSFTSSRSCFHIPASMDTHSWILWFSLSDPRTDPNCHKDYEICVSWQPSDCTLLCFCHHTEPSQSWHAIICCMLLLIRREYFREGTEVLITRQQPIRSRILKHLLWKSHPELKTSSYPSLAMPKGSKFCLNSEQIPEFCGKSSLWIWICWPKRDNDSTLNFWW